MLMISRIDHKYYDTNDFNCYWHETRDVAFTKPNKIPSQQNQKYLYQQLICFVRFIIYFLTSNRFDDKNLYKVY